MKILRRERIYRWSVPQHGIEGSKGGDHHMWVQEKGVPSSDTLKRQQELHVEQFERIMLTHARTSSTAAAMVALALGDQKLLRLATVVSMKAANAVASGESPAIETKDLLESGGMAGKGSAASMLAVDDDTSASESELSDGHVGQLEGAAVKSPTLDMGFYRPSANGVAAAEPGADAASPKLPKLKTMHTSTDRMAGMVAPPQWLRWVGLVQSDGSLVDCGHGKAYQGGHAFVGDGVWAGNSSSSSEALPSLLGRVRVRSSMVRSVDSAIKSVQFDSRIGGLGFQGLRIPLRGLRNRPSAPIVVLHAAIDKAATLVSADEVEATEELRASRREKRQLQEQRRSRALSAMMRRKKDHVLSMLRSFLRPFGRAAVRDALEPVVEAHAAMQSSSEASMPRTESKNSADVAAASAVESRALLEMQPHLGPAFPALYPILRSVMRDLSPADLDSLHSRAEN